MKTFINSGFDKHTPRSFGGEIKKGCSTLSGHQKAGRDAEGRFSPAKEVMVSKLHVRRQIKMEEPRWGVCHLLRESEGEKSRGVPG